MTTTGLIFRGDKNVLAKCAKTHTNRRQGKSSYVADKRNICCSSKFSTHTKIIDSSFPEGSKGIETLLTSTLPRITKHCNASSTKGSSEMDTSSSFPGANYSLLPRDDHNSQVVFSHTRRCLHEAVRVFHPAAGYHGSRNFSRHHHPPPPPPPGGSLGLSKVPSF